MGAVSAYPSSDTSDPRRNNAPARFLQSPWLSLLLPPPPLASSLWPSRGGGGSKGESCDGVRGGVSSRIVLVEASCRNLAASATTDEDGWNRSMRQATRPGTRQSSLREGCRVVVAGDAPPFFLGRHMSSKDEECRTKQPGAFAAAVVVSERACAATREVCCCCCVSSRSPTSNKSRCFVRGGCNGCAGDMVGLHNGFNGLVHQSIHDCIGTSTCRALS